MSKKIMVLTGSSRPNSAGDKVLPHITSAIEELGATAVVADLRELDLPFFDEDHIPAAEGYQPKNENAKKFQELVQNSDGVVLLSPEYNNQMSAIQKNAFDWLYTDWKDKPVSVVGYSWTGVTPVLEQIEKLVKKVDGDYKGEAAQLFFTKDIDLEGNLLDENGAKEKISGAVKAVVEV